MGISASINKVISLERSLNKAQESFGKSPIERIDSIEFNKVSFSFDSYKVLSNINLKFSKGKSFAIVGASGSGKTTLLNLLTSLYSASKGEVMINGVDLNSINQNMYRDLIGYVSQDLVYFDGSIKENIKLGNSSIADMDTIIDKISLRSVVKERGIDKNISDFGRSLSGGQLQKINIARELFKNPEFLILDEATSALDSNSEKKAIDYILSMKEDKIIVVVAHRMSSIKNIDEILFIDNNSIVNSGSMKKLYNSNEKFKSMCNKQSIFL